ncbi:MAG TPA: thiopeptide-type bacteriocin biosynthesis protein [Ktedonobacteraceae bacterium]|nr:thiopeptide-type bacteriocin biosynthesis protein [Ktedonobacteraceae bacterium]
MPKSVWLSAHLFYYKDLSALLTNCIQPVVTECRARHLIDAYFFIRYWQGGPHARLRLLPSTEDTAQVIQAILAQQARRFFEADPSSISIDTQIYDTLTEHLSQVEYGEDLRVPLQAANSLQYIPYQPEYEHYGGPVAMPYIEIFFMHSSDVALDLLTIGLNKKQRTGQAVSMLLLAMAQFAQNLDELVALCDDHLHTWHALPASLREQLDTRFGQRYQTQRSQLQQLVTGLLDVAWGKSSEQLPAPLARWLSASRDLSRTLQQLADSGELQTNAPSGQLEPRMAILFRCLHMHNNRLGILMLEEFYVLFLLRQALADLAGRNGISAQESDRSFVEGVH